MLAADTIDALVDPPADETPACFWTPGDAQVAVCPVDTTVTDPVVVPSIATDPLPLIDSVLDTSTVLPIFVVDPTEDSDGTGLLTDGTSQETGDPSFDSGISDGSADGSDADAIDVRVQFVSSDVGWAAYYYSVARDGAVTGVSVFASYDEPTLAAFVAEHADDASVQMFDCGDGWWISGFPPELAPPVPVGDQTFVDPTTETDSLTGEAIDGSANDWGRVLMAEDIVAFAGSDQPVAAISSEGRAAAFATLPDSAQANLASMYAAFAAGFSQSSADGQGSGVFVGTKRSARH
jgi:hypothetical protein